MAYPTRIYYSEADKALMWDRWQKGESLNSIGRHFGRSHSSIQNILSRTGGIRPPQRKRSVVALSLAEREEISRGVVAGRSIRSIAASLRRAPSTVSREINRNGGRRRYRANEADQAAWDRAHRPKPCKLVENRALTRIVAKKLRKRWSPEQIAGWLKSTYPDNENDRSCRDRPAALCREAVTQLIDRMTAHEANFGHRRAFADQSLNRIADGNPWLT